MSKRKETLPSPVQLKKNKEGEAESAPATPNTIEEQRRKAKEWFDKEEKKKAEALAVLNNAKRSASPVQTPSKKSKPQADDDEESVVSTRSLRRRSSIGSATVTETDNASIRSEASSVRPSRTPAKSKKSELATIQEEVPIPSSVRKNTKAPNPEPASARKALTKPTPVEAPSSPLQTTLAVSPKVTPRSPKQITLAQTVVQRTPITQPSVVIERHAEVTAVVEPARAPLGAGNNLNPPNALFVLLGQLYIFIGGIAYYNPSLGFALFILVNALANYFVVKGRKD